AGGRAARLHHGADGSRVAAAGVSARAAGGSAGAGVVSSERDDGGDLGEPAVGSVADAGATGAAGGGGAGVSHVRPLERVEPDCDGVGGGERGVSADGPGGELFAQRGRRAAGTDLPERAEDGGAAARADGDVVRVAGGAGGAAVG